MADDRALFLAYVPRRRRAAVAALLTLDGTLADILRSTREPMVGQMRLTWWHGALTALDAAPPPAQPVLQALAAHVLPGTGGAALAEMIDGWEELLEPDPLSDVGLARYAERRGAGLFRALAAALGDGDADVTEAGRGWALVDLADHASDPELRARCLALAAAAFDAAFRSRWPRAARPIGALARLSMDRNRSPTLRLLRLLRFRWTGL